MTGRSGLKIQTYTFWSGLIHLHTKDYLTIAFFVS